MWGVTGIEFIELLARDASAVEFEGPVLAARSAGAASDTIAELERAKGLALQVRAVLEARRRRESELSALYETANDLAALTDLDAVLQAIVNRARGRSAGGHERLLDVLLRQQQGFDLAGFHSVATHA